MNDCTLSIVKSSKELKIIIEHVRYLLFAWQPLTPTALFPETSPLHALLIALLPLALNQLHSELSYSEVEDVERNKVHIIILLPLPCR